VAPAARRPRLEALAATACGARLATGAASSGVTVRAIQAAGLLASQRDVQAATQPWQVRGDGQSRAICLSSTVLFQCQWRIITGIFLNDGTPRWLCSVGFGIQLEHGWNMGSSLNILPGSPCCCWV
jgi:hypothetical protein